MMAKSQKGFTLVELSIVIVIIGFLVAGISAGSELVKSAKLRSIITDINELDLAYSNFISKYNYKPGDFPSAYSLWPACGESAAACNGNGDGIIRWDNGAITSSTGDEGIKAMYQLYYSGMYNKRGAISQIYDAYGNFFEYTSANYFPTLNADTTSTMVVTGSGTSNFWFFTTNIFPTDTHGVYIFDEGIEIGGNFFMNAGLSAVESFRIDEKIDNGTITGSGASGAETGNFRAMQGGEGGGTLSSNCKTADVYDLTSTGKACIVGKKTNIQ